MNRNGGMAVVERGPSWATVLRHVRVTPPRVYDEASLSENEQRLTNAILKAVRSELSALDRKIDAATGKYEQVLQTIDDNLSKLETEVEGDDGDDDDEAPARKRGSRGVVDQGDGEDDDDDEGAPAVSAESLPEEVKSLLAFERRRQEKRIKKLEEQVADRDKKAFDAERRARDAQTARMLNNAVAAANAADPKAATKLLLMDKVRWDDEKGYPVYTTSEGAEFVMTDENYDTFADAVKDDMPDWMRRAAAGTGGSGATPAKAADRLEMAKRELSALEKAAESNDDHAIARMHAKRREIEGLQVDVEKVKR